MRRPINKIWSQVTREATNEAILAMRDTASSTVSGRRKTVKVDSKGALEDDHFTPELQPIYVESRV